jgi:hypothetical protein
MGRVVIGMDPHKCSSTIEVLDEHEQVLAVGRYGTDKAGYAAMLKAGRAFADRVWAIEGCAGIGKHIARRLVHDGETVFDVPPKLSARVGCSPPAMAARPTRSTRTRSPSRPCGRQIWCRCRWIRTWW